MLRIQIALVIEDKLHRVFVQLSMNIFLILSLFHTGIYNPLNYHLLLGDVDACTLKL